MRSSIFYIFLFLMVACSEDIGSNRFNRPSLQEEQAPDPVDLPQYFKTRLTNELLISGARCIGGEAVIDENRETHFCERNQFIVTIDNVNTCDSTGCSETFVEPIIAALQLLDDDRSVQFDFFDIDPISPTTSEQDEILVRVQVRADNTTAQVEFKPNSNL